MNIWKLAKKNGTVDDVYEHEVIKRIRQKYSIDQELAILRQRDTKPTEFEEYNAFVENCKRDVKKEMGEA
jgi:hypothetical protein